MDVRVIIGMMLIIGISLLFINKTSLKVIFNAVKEFWNNPSVEKGIFIIIRLFAVGVIIAVLLINDNFKAILSPPQVKLTSELGGVFFTPLNLRLAGVALYVALWIIIFYLFYLLTVSFERINIFGLGIKDRAERAMDMANVEIELYRKLEIARLSILTAVQKTQFRKNTGNMITDSDSLDVITNVYVNKLVTLIETFFDSIAGAKVTAGWISTASKAELSNLPEDIRFVVSQALQMDERRGNKQKSIIAIPLYLQGERYLIFFIKAEDKTFAVGEADVLFIRNCWQIITRYILIDAKSA